MIFFCLQTSAQVKAEFTATPVVGCTPLFVQFTDISTGGATSWFWDLGNGITSVSKNPGVIYFNPGLYTVKLVVKNATSSDSIIKSSFINVSDKPSINFIASDTTGCNPLSVNFTDLTTSGSGSISQWQWDFGDGNTSNIKDPFNSYTSSGSYNVTLKVTNSEGCTNILTKNAYIKVKASPVASFNTFSATSCSPPVTVNFTNTSTGNNIIGYNWDFGDGNTSTATNPSHNYSVAGVFNAQLQVKNQAGCTNTISKLISIGDVTPNFTIPDTVCQNDGFFIYNTSIPTTVSSYWTFGDGTFSAQNNPYKIYTSSGNFIVKLVNNFGACKDSISKQIVVIGAPSAAFTYTPSNPGCKLPATVSFNANAGNNSFYFWDFGDGGTSTLQSPVHVYNNKGSYTVRLIVKNSFGCTDSTIISNAVVIEDPEISSIDNLPFSGCVPITFNFVANISSPEPIVNYLWSFGDNTTSSQISPSHTYTVTGAYDIRLIITTQSGCKDTLLVSDGIKVGTKPVANFTATPTNACGYQNIKFTNTSVGNTTAWFWDFGDSTYSGLQNPTHVYNDTGYFSVLLVTENNGCIDSIRKNNFIFIKPPIAIFEVTHYCDTPYLKKFVSKSLGAVTYLWDFGDGTTSTLANPTHIYSAKGSYKVVLRVDNAPCYDFMEDSVYVIDEQPNINIQPVSTCKYQPVNFSCIGVNANYFSQYLWTFGDTSNQVTTKSQQISHTYTSSGTYNITLKTVDLNGCLKIVTKTSGVTIYGPLAKLSFNKGSCVNNDVVFSDQSIPYSGFPIVSRTIDYGDGTVFTTPNNTFSHIYTNTGTYDITYIVIDSKGCSDTLKFPAGITITKAVALFRISDSILCRQSIIDFTNASIGSSLTYRWNFGDGDTSILRSPSHVYTTNGIYTVTLKVTDRFGCSDSITKPNLITIGNAKADFMISDSVANCPPAQINFTNQSTYFSSLKWDFDNGSTSTINNPSHTYVVSGTYNVKLVVKGFGTCVDSMIKKVIIKGPRGTLSYTPLGKCGPADISFTATATNISSNFTWDFGDGNTIVSTGNTITHTYLTPGRYLPKLLLRDNSINCLVLVTGSDSISVSSLRAYFKKTKTTYCDSATISFSDSSIIKYDTAKVYKWDFGDGTFSSIPNPIHTYTTPGLYDIRLSINTAFGCSDTTAAYRIKIVKSPSVSITGKSSACLFDSLSYSLTLASPDTSATTFFWDFGNGNAYTGNTPPAQIFTTPQNYIIKVVALNSSGCTDTVINPLIIHPLPTVNAGADTILCRGQNIQLIPTGANNYTWQSNTDLSCTNCTSPTALPDSSTAYFVTGISAAGCTATDSIKVNVIQPFKIAVSQGDTLCRGETIRLSVLGAKNYTWSPSAGLSNINSASPIAKPDNTTRYRVIGMDDNGCFADTAYVLVVVYSIPFFNIVPEVMNIPGGSSATITTAYANDITKFEWSPSSGLSCTNCPQPLVTPVVNSTVYKATVTNAGGCSNSDEVTVNMQCGNGSIFIPNTFSPNADGSNDMFYPRGKGIKGVKSMTIFNRWGSVVFQRTNFQLNDSGAGWDGTYKGQPAPADVYIYQLEILCGTGNQFLYKGDVTLVR